MAQTKEKEKIAKTAKKLSQEELERAAYFHWLNRGCPTGDPISDWLEAEKEFAGNAGARTTSKKS